MSANRVMCALASHHVSLAEHCSFQTLLAEVVVLDVPRNLGLVGSFHMKLEIQPEKCSEKGSSVGHSVWCLHPFALVGKQGLIPAS